MIFIFREGILDAFEDIRPSELFEQLFISFVSYFFLFLSQIRCQIMHLWAYSDEGTNQELNTFTLLLGCSLVGENLWLFWDAWELIFWHTYLSTKSVSSFDCMNWLTKAFLTYMISQSDISSGLKLSQIFFFEKLDWTSARGYNKISYWYAVYTIIFYRSD